MPPGVNPSDIPGNRPEDIEEERYWSHLDKKFEEVHGKGWMDRIDKLLSEGDPRDNEAILDYVQMARDISYSAGYKQGQHDAFEEVREEHGQS